MLVACCFSCQSPWQAIETAISSGSSSMCQCDSKIIINSSNNSNTFPTTVATSNNITFIKSTAERVAANRYRCCCLLATTPQLIAIVAAACCCVLQVCVLSLLFIYVFSFSDLRCAAREVHARKPVLATQAGTATAALTIIMMSCLFCVHACKSQTVKASTDNGL